VLAEVETEAGGEKFLTKAVVVKKSRTGNKEDSPNTLEKKKGKTTGSHAESIKTYSLTKDAYRNGEVRTSTRGVVFNQTNYEKVVEKEKGKRRKRR